MILTILTLLVVNIILFFLVIIFLSFFKTKFSISKKTFISGFISFVLIYFYLGNFYKNIIDHETIISFLIIYILILSLFNIYFPLLLDRSFSISIIFDIFAQNNSSEKKIINIYKKKFPIFIKRRIKDLATFNFIKKINKKIILSNKGLVLLRLMKVIKKIYKI